MYGVTIRPSHVELSRDTYGSVRDQLDSVRRCVPYAGHERYIVPVRFAIANVVVPVGFAAMRYCSGYYLS